MKSVLLGLTIVSLIALVSGAAYAADSGIAGIGASAFNATSGTANVSYTLNSVNHGHVTLEIFDSMGAQVRAIDGGYQDSGARSIAWDGKDNSGKAVPQGNYTVVLKVESTDPTSYAFTMLWGGKGNASGQLLYPRGIKADRAGNVYVADAGNNRVQVFGPNGTFSTGNFNSGSMLPQSFWPNDIALAPDGSVYVCQISGAASIKKFDAAGNVLKDIGAAGSKAGQYLTPYAIDCDGDGNLYVLDNSFGQAGVLKYDANGNFLAKWGSYGAKDGQFGAPDGIAVGTSGRVYVSDTLNDRVQVFDLDGNLLKTFGSHGTGDGQFIKPKGIAASPLGYVYVADSDNTRIQVFDLDGNFATKFGSNTAVQLTSVEGVAADPDGNVYVTDYNNATVLKFSPARLAFNGTCHIIVDQSPPVTELTLSGAHDANGTYAVGAMVALAASDSGSGVSLIHYSLDGANWSSYNAPFALQDTGNVMIYYRSTDQAGNQEVAKSMTVAVAAQVTATEAATSAPTTATPASGLPYGALFALFALVVGATWLAYKKK